MDAANQLSSVANDLQSCEQEPLQFIGSIQSIGGLIAFTIEDRRIQAASENIEKFLAVRHQDVVSSKLDHIFDPVLADRAVALIKDLTLTRNRANFIFEREGQRFDGAVFVTDGLAFLEFEPHTVDQDVSDIVNQALVELRTETRLQDLATRVCQAVFRITGMDRVMMYRFLPPHEHGEVIAEHRVLSAQSYNRHRFPASDIPRIARDLYLRNQVRHIPNIDLPTSRILPAQNPITGEAINLSDSRLRAVSPVHLEYMRNMNVACSFSVAVIVERRLWALITCHHLTEKRIPAAQRTACEIIANAFAGQARLLEESELSSRKVLFLSKLNSIFEGILLSDKADDGLLRRHQLMFEAFRATGVAVVKGDHVDYAGLCPPRTDLTGYAKAFLRIMNEENVDVISSDSIREDFPDLPQEARLACGTLATKISDDVVTFLFRTEFVDTIIWGGDPRKQLDRANLNGRINPRKSFAAWEEKIRGRALPWEDYEIEGFRRLKDLIFEKMQRSKAP